jgi:hypothetical protein
MQKDFPLGTEGKMVLKVEAGKLVIEAIHSHKSGEVKVSISENPDYFLDLLANLIPGVWDDAVIALAKDAIKRL